MTKRPKKRSLTLKGHRTSVSLEDPFWEEFRKLAANQSRPINDLASEIDSGRGGDIGLASAIRLYILRQLTHPDG
ncbi:ribbon-helix-helix domain-containing protein [uncultured Litoreibacter sp.]|uniref:ribbon-helix-helix domain-containing protein n=1 Tax=uncultured Litoreibacter sp. TaxID=1392394 RepID=UPI002613EEF0|nr:ribbon-helix-helix domain-containing protein [uncultured Litoreibacter sp.]